MPVIQQLFLFDAIDAGIQLGGADGGMAEHVLDVLDVDIVFKQQGGKGVAKGVGSDFSLGGYFLGERIDKDADGLVGELAAQAIEQKEFALGMESLRAAVQIALHQGQRPCIADLDVAFLASLSLQQQVAGF